MRRLMRCRNDRLLRSAPSSSTSFAMRRCSSTSESTSQKNSPKRVMRQYYGEKRFQDYVLKERRKVVERDGGGEAEAGLELRLPRGRVNKVKMNTSWSVFLKQSSNDVASYFLPKGYPKSVSAGYDSFVRGQMFAMVLATASGVLSMQSMLFAIGIGSGSFPLAATLNWVIKDGLGQLGGVFFASIVSNRFDADPKRWRLVSTVAMDISSFIELLTPLVPHYFLPMASVANVGKNISFLASSASRAAIHKSFAIHENLADVTAKTGSQCILSSLVGTSLGLSIAAACGGNYASVITVFMCCSALNIASTYGSLQGVTLTSLSLPRMDCVLNDYVDRSAASRARFDKYIEEDKVKEKELDGSSNYASMHVKSASQQPHEEDPSTFCLTLMSPRQLMAMETLLGAPETGMVELNVGADLDVAVKSQLELQELLREFAQDEFIVNAYTSKSNSSAHVYLLMKVEASKASLLQGLVFAYFVRKQLLDEGYGKSRRSFMPTVNTTNASGLFDKFKIAFGGGDRDASNASSTLAAASAAAAAAVAAKGNDSQWRVDLIRKARAMAQKDDICDKFITTCMGQREWLVDNIMLETRLARVCLHNDVLS